MAAEIHFRLVGRSALPAALVAALSVYALPASAAGKINYGTRAGMQVSVVSMSGLNTAHAVIRTKHTREDAVAFCREYVQKVTPDCIREELKNRLNDQITANCVTGEFSDFRGGRHRFAGPSHKGDGMAKYRVIDLGTRQDADGSMASGYPVYLDLYKALCPARAPSDE